MQFEVGPAGESAMRLAYAESPHPALTRGLLVIQELAERRFAGSLIDAVIGYTTLTLFFNGLSWSGIALKLGYAIKQQMSPYKTQH